MPALGGTSQAGTVRGRRGGEHKRPQDRGHKEVSRPGLGVAGVIKGTFRPGPQLGGGWRQGVLKPHQEGGCPLPRGQAASESQWPEGGGVRIAEGQVWPGPLRVPPPRSVSFPVAGHPECPLCL